MPALSASKKQKTLKNYLSFLEPQVISKLKKSILIGSLAGLVEYGFAFILQLFLFSLGILTQDQLTVPAWLPRGLTFTLIALVCVGIFRSFVVGSNIYNSRMASQTFYKIKRSRVVALSLENGHRISTPEAVSMFTDEINRAGHSVMCFSGLVTQCLNATILFSIGMYLAPQQMLIGILMLVVVYIPIRMLSRGSKITGADLTLEWQNTSDTLLSGLRNHFFLNIYGLIENEKKRAEGSLNQYFQHFRSFISITAIKLSAPTFLGLLIISVILLFSAKATAVNGAVLLSFLFIFLRFVQSIGEMAGLWNDFKIYQESAFALQEWLDAQSTPDPHKNTLVSDKKLQNRESIQLQLKNLRFTYSDDTQKELFKNLNLKVGKGDCLVITGESGSGKSTLLSLMLGALKPTSGEVLVNFESVADVKTDISTLLGYVGPAPYLVEGTILDNLLYGNSRKDGVSGGDVTQALKAAEICDFVDSLPKGLQTQLNEIGNNISTGQRQRLSIARAFLRRPKLLIMDEATSNLDLATEAKIIENLKPILPEMTTVIVSHRKAYLDLATQRVDLN